MLFPLSVGSAAKSSPGGATYPMPVIWSPQTDINSDVRYRKSEMKNADPLMSTIMLSPPITVAICSTCDVLGIVCHRNTVKERPF
jgi:hypothetical protein